MRFLAARDATIAGFSTLPLAGVDAQAYAMVGGRAQNGAPTAADEVFVVAIRGEPGFVVDASLWRPRAIPACTAARAAAEKLLDAAFARSGSSGDHEKMRDAIAAEFIRCFAERASKEKRFADAVRSWRAHSTTVCPRSRGGRIVSMVDDH